MPSLALERQPRFVFTGSDFTMQIPARPWGRATRTVGGLKKSATGVPASYIVRRDHVLTLTLRFFESEWTNVHTLIAWGQAGESITFYPDALVSGTNYACYMDAPAAGTDIAPVRDGEYPLVMEVTIELRKTSGAIWTDEFFT